MTRSIHAVQRERSRGRIGVRVLLFVGGFLLAGAAAALAYWTVTVILDPSSYALAQANSLSAPTTPTHTVNGSGAITIGWTLPGSQLPGAVYQVDRTSGPGSPTEVCQTTSTSCQDIGLTASTTYDYSVTAVLDDWQSAAITTSAMTATPSFAISLSAGPYTAGTPITVTEIQAEISGVVDPTYTGPETINWSGLANSPSGQPPSYPPSSVSFTNGVATPNSTFTAYLAGSNTLTATDANATSVTGSTTFNISAGTATQISMTGSTGDLASGTTRTFTATIEDAAGNPITSGPDSTDALSFSQTSTPPGSVNFATPSSTSNGVATDVVTGNRAGSVTIKASGTVNGSATNSNTQSFTVTVGSAAQLAFTPSPSNSTGGTAFGTQPKVTVEDAGGNTVTGDSSTVTLAIGTNPSGGTLTCTGGLSKAASSGVATFAGCKIDKSGNGYTLTATDGSLTSATSGTFNITVGSAAQLAFTPSPSNSTGGTAFGTQPKVTVEDAGGNTVTGDSSTVTLAIGTNPSGGTLTCTGGLSKAASSGVATFAGCKIDKSGNGYTLTATDGSLTSATSGTFNITVGSAAQLAFTPSPSNSTGGVAFSPNQPVVTVEDAGGNTVTGDSSTVTLAIGTNPSGGTLTCTGGLSKAASSGVATFAGCKIDKSGNGYTLTATDGSLTSATSGTFNITVGSAAQLAFTTSPSNSTGGVAFSPNQPVVTVEDAGGNTVTGDSSTVTLAIGTNPSGGTLTCTGGLSKAASSGVATFAGCKIDKSGNGYTLTATDGSLTSATSGTFNITVGSAAQLAFTPSPSNSTGGTAFGTQPKVTVEDAGGNTVTGDSSTVTLAIGTNPSGGTLTCTGGLSKAASSGVATFAGCKIDKSGNGYTLTATDGSLTSATSGTFNITVGSAAQLAFTPSPSNSTGGVAFSPNQPVVTVEDAGGNTVTTDTSTVTLAITSGTPTTGGPGTLTCTGGLSKAASSGVATFAGCKIDKSGNGYTLTATDGSLTSATSGTFNITVGSAAQLAFTPSPSNSTGGTAFGTQPKVTVEDAGGNTVTGDSSTVTLAIGTNPSGGTLTCTGGLSKAASSGVATFAGCKIDKSGNGYTLTATDGSLTSATSGTFNITVGSAAQLAFTPSPSNSTGGVAFSPNQPVVTVEDAGGNTVTGDSSTVTLAIGTNPSGGTLTCTGGLSKAASSGVATFAGCKIDKSGNGYTLTATDGSLTSATSGTFNITVGSAAQLAFTTSPSNSTGGVAFSPNQPVVTVEDAGGNTVTGDSSTVTLAIGTNPSGGTLTCTGGLSKAASSGVATFAGCKIDKSGNGYTLTATDGSLTSATSGTFNITVGSAAQLAFTPSPSNSTGGVAFSPNQPVVTVEDAGGNTVTGDSSTVTLAIGTNPSGGTLTCTGGLSKAASSGVATFAGCKIDKSGNGYTLTATDGSLTSATSGTFNITVGSAAQLAFTTSPSNSTGGVAFSPNQPVVTVEDAGGNTVTGDSSTVTLAIGTNPSGGTLTCTGGLSKAASSGVATFAGCKIDKSGNGYTLTATDGSLTSATSGTFNITVGSAAQLAFTPSPSNSTGGTAFGTQPKVTVEDAGGNTVTGDSSTVTLAIGTNPSGGTLTCTGGLSKAASSGVATFAGCKIDKSGNGYTLTATDGSLTSATSGTFNITVGSAAQLAFTTSPSNSTGGVAFSPNQPVVTVEDAGGNTVTTDTSTVTLAITSGTPTTGGPGTLTCTGGLSKAASSGVATFAGCAINTTGTGYKLHATDTGLTAADSGTFNITVGSAAQLAFTTSPSNSTGGVAFSPNQPVVTVEDAGGNTVTTDTSTVTLAITSGTPTTGGPGTLTCTGGLSKAASSGVATFAGCAINTTGTGYKLHATDTGLTAADSGTFNITVGSAAQLAFTTSPSNSTGGVAFSPNQPVVTVEDAGGNTVTTDTSTVTLAITSGTPTTGGPGTLTCTGGLSKAASSGVATFAGCKIDKSGNGYELHATDGSLTAVDSSAFNVTVGPAAQFLVSAPASATAGTAITGITLTAEDAGGNIVTTYTGSHTIAWSGANTSPAGTAPTYPVTSVSFTSGGSTTALSAILFAAGSNTLTASATSPTVTGSATITVTALAAASHIAWNSFYSSAGTQAGTIFALAYTGCSGGGCTFTSLLALTDAYGNPVNNSTGNPISITVTTDGGSFTGSPTVSIPNGSSVSSSGGDGTVAGQIKFSTGGGSYGPDHLTATPTPTYTTATASFTK